MEENSMLNSAYLKRQARASIIISTISFIFLLLLIASGFVMPEHIGLPIFMFALPTMVLSGTIGIILGSRGLQSAERRLHLWGLAVGEAAMVSLLALIFVAWFRAVA
jgi:hypothetical protein